MYLARISSCLPLSMLLCAAAALGQSAPDAPHGDPAPALAENVSGCGEAPREDALVALCAPPSSAEEQPVAAVERTAPATIALTIPTGTPLRIAVDQRGRINHPHRMGHGKGLETVYPFDHLTLNHILGMIAPPPLVHRDAQRRSGRYGQGNGSRGRALNCGHWLFFSGGRGGIATGHVKSIAPVSGLKRTMAYANGDFSPFHGYEVTFDMVTLPDGRQLPITTTVMPGTAEVVHLVSKPAKQKGATDRAKVETKGKVA